MLDKKISQIKRRIESFAEKGIIKKEKEKDFVQFFLNNAKNSLETAELLLKVSTDNNFKNTIGIPGFNGLLWVINSSYYSMFYTARVLLENEGIKIKTEMSIHSITFDALVYYFYLSGKLQKELIEDFAEAKEEASEILGSEKAKELIENYFYERRKREKFTYEMGNIVIQQKAKTSLDRARKFNEEIRKIIEK